MSSVSVRNFNKFGSAKRAAAVVISLGVDYASKVYQYLNEDEIEQLTREIAIMEDLSPDVMQKTLEDFYNLCLAQKVVTVGGMEYARSILEQSLGSATAAKLLDRVKNSMRTRAFSFLNKADPTHLLSFIQNEHPQTIALILSYITPLQASDILSELPREVQVDVAQRIAKMDRTSPEYVKEVERMLEQKFTSVAMVDFTEIGGINHIAEILNCVDRSTEKYILEEMNNTEPVITEEIRKKMFVFEDIATLDPPSIQRFLQDVDSKDLVIALKGVNADIAEVFYSNMSTRMRDMLRDDAQYLRGVRMSDVEHAQQKLVALVRNLEETGQVVIARGRKDEIIV